MKKKITACLACAALICGMCGCNGGEDKSSANGETETVTTVTEASETASETSVTTEAKTETETSETTETTETTKSTEVLTVSPSGYLLDPNVTLGEENGWYFPEKQPCLIGEPLEGVRFYGLNGGEELSYTYDQPAWGEDEYDQYIIIEHDGVADEFAGLWTERFGNAMSLYSGDFDGDGETEIASVRYSIGGTFCSVMELAVYKLNEGHYERFMFNTQDFNDKYISVDIDSENKVLTVSAKGFDQKFTYDFSEDAPPEMTDFEVDLVQLNGFVVDGSEITYIATPIFCGYGPVTFVNICFKLNFSDGEFTCSGVEFIEEQF